MWAPEWACGCGRQANWGENAECLGCGEKTRPAGHRTIPKPRRIPNNAARRAPTASRRNLSPRRAPARDNAPVGGAVRTVTLKPDGPPAPPTGGKGKGTPHAPPKGPDATGTVGTIPRTVPRGHDAATVLQDIGDSASVPARLARLEKLYAYARDEYGVDGPQTVQLKQDLDALRAQAEAAKVPTSEDHRLAEERLVEWKAELERRLRTLESARLALDAAELAVQSARDAISSCEAHLTRVRTGGLLQPVTDTAASLGRLKAGLSALEAGRPVEPAALAALTAELTNAEGAIGRAAAPVAAARASATESLAPSGPVAKAVSRQQLESVHGTPPGDPTRGGVSKPRASFLDAPRSSDDVAALAGVGASGSMSPTSPVDATVDDSAVPDRQVRSKLGSNKVTAASIGESFVRSLGVSPSPTRRAKRGAGGAPKQEATASPTDDAMGVASAAPVVTPTPDVVPNSPWAPNVSPPATTLGALQPSGQRFG